MAVPVQGTRLSSLVYRYLAGAINEIGLQIANPQVVEPPPEDARARFNPKDIYKENCDILKTSDLLIAEISSPSLGVGYEIASAEYLGLPILCVYQSNVEQFVSLMILGISYPELRFVRYQTFDDLKTNLMSAIQTL